MSALDALYMPLREQAAQIAAGELDPAELLDACLARIEERNPELNAVIATFPDDSRRMLERGTGWAAARRPGRDQGRVAAALARRDRRCA